MTLCRVDYNVPGYTSFLILHGIITHYYPILKYTPIQPLPPAYFPRRICAPA